MFAQLNLRQKLAVVRRRIAYVQKRGHNPRFNYNYVTAADIAGAVGDILAELGVVVVPRLESISHEAMRPSAGGTEHVTHVVMSYSFVDVDTAEEITVKTAGEGLDSGDKAPYKAMTGALKYALLQSFLLATGDDPEEERTSPVNHSSPTHESDSERRRITTEQIGELGQLIADTGTELERVLAYYKTRFAGGDDGKNLSPRGRTAQSQTLEAGPGRGRPCPELSGSIRTPRNGSAGGLRASGQATHRHHGREQFQDTTSALVDQNRKVNRRL
jgi:hypothetical protein